MQIESIEIKIDGTMYHAYDVREAVKASDEPRRLILYLYYHTEINDVPSDASEKILARSITLKYTFAQKFPDVQKFGEQVTTYPMSSQWKYVLTDAQPEHIQWAKHARDCGFIDHYTVDHGKGMEPDR